MSNPWFLYPVFFICIFLFCYIWADRLLQWIYRHSLGQRDEIFALMDRMFVDTDKQKVSRMIWALSGGLGIIGFIICWPNLIAGVIVGLILSLVGWNAPKMILRQLFEKRCNRLVAQMVEGLTIMANGISSGLSITQSMERVVDNLGNPISQEFGLVLSQVRLGQTVEDSLINLAERIPRADVQMFVTAINILKETGGNLAETFSTIVVTIRERQKVERKIEALTAQGLMQGIIITLVPLVLLAVMFVISPAYVKPLFTTTLGIILMLVAVTLQIIGGLVIRKIVKIKV